MSHPMQASRRQFLRASGAMLALPLFESLLPRSARAVTKAPQRLLFYFVPNGIHMPAWTPSSEGTDYALTPILKPLDKLKSEAFKTAIKTFVKIGRAHV